MAVKLTERQQQILELIRSEITRTGFPPTRAEIARALGFKSANAAEDHLKALAKKGAIELRSEEHTSELQSLMSNSYAVFCLKKNNTITHRKYNKANPQTTTS